MSKSLYFDVPYLFFCEGCGEVISDCSPCQCTTGKAEEEDD